MSYLYVAAGSAIGGMLRWFVAETINPNPKIIAGKIFSNIPWETLLINVLGSFLIGFVASLSGEGGVIELDERIRIFLFAGIFGGFTTFSSFSLQTLELFLAGEYFSAASYIFASFFFSLLFVFLGFILTKLIFH